MLFVNSYVSFLFCAGYVNVDDVVVDNPPKSYRPSNSIPLVTLRRLSYFLRQ